MSAAPQTDDRLELFLIAAPGLETTLGEEAREAGLAEVAVVEGGITCRGDWPDVWRANLALRGATRVLVRIASFRAMHLAQLDRRARKVPWSSFLRPDLPVAVEASCRKSKIYHAGAAAQRVATAIGDTLGAPVVERAAVTVMVRIEDDLATISIDSSGEPLYKRGHKEAVNRAPMRETMAALFLRQCGYAGAEPVVDPMCGSGTFVIEAAEWAAGLMPGRNRSFAFESLVGFDRAAWEAIKAQHRLRVVDLTFFGSDRDVGAVAMSRENAERAGLSALTRFTERSVADLEPPDGPPGLVICNPPYGMRIGDKRELQALYAALGKALKTRFKGWRAGIVTADPGLAKSTSLRFLPPGKPVLHGGLRVSLWRTEVL